MDINLWNPASGMSVGLVIVTAFLLGIVHGITPDEHTWPITFSYAIGSYSTRGGVISGLVFSAAFTLQRMVGCVLAYLALSSWMESGRVDAVVYMIVGLAMAAAGVYILRLGHVFHLHILPSRWSGGHRSHMWQQDGARSHAPRGVTPWMAAVHGFIAGWGFGAFATILYATLAPSMPNVFTSWIPGLAFGLGTMATQAAVGALFGWWMRRRRLPEQVIGLVARGVAGQTLLWGGIAFGLAGVLDLIVPDISSWGIATPIRVHNLHHLGLGFILVILVVMVIGGTSIIRALRRAESAAISHSASRYG